MWKVYECGDDSIFESKTFFTTNDFAKEKKSSNLFPQIIFTTRKKNN